MARAGGDVRAGAVRLRESGGKGPSGTNMGMTLSRMNKKMEGEEGHQELCDSQPIWYSRMLAVHVSLVIIVPREALASPSAIFAPSWASVAFDNVLCPRMVFSGVAFKVFLP
jgi:hypothetical protein